MAIPKNVPVSSIKALTRSIQSDYQVYRWFRFLITQQPVKQDLIKIKNAKQLYYALRTKSLLLNVALIILFGLFSLVLLKQQYPLIWLIALLVYISCWIYKTKKIIVSQISAILLLHDFEASKLSLKTLYQIGEVYGRQYNMPSLVSTIYNLDNIRRKAVIIIMLSGIIIHIFVHQFNYAHNIFFLVGLYYLLHAFINLPVIYRLLK